MYLEDIVAIDSSVLKSAKRTVVENEGTDLDQVLRDLIKLVHTGQERNPNKYGMVAASVIGPDGERIDRVNYMVNGTDKRVHAERAAVEAYIEKYGDSLEDCTVVTTCSPCSQPMDDRYGVSCEDFLNDMGVRNIYCGYQDPGHERNYIITSDSDVYDECKSLADTFTEPDTINESKNHDIIRRFLPWLQREIGLDHLPEIELLDQPVSKSFGGYNSETGKLQVVTTGRHPVDVLRTLAHELVHRRQDTEGQLSDGSGETGSPQENEANAEAGVVMRNFAQQNPDAFGLSEDFTGKAKPGSRPGSLLRKAGKKKGEKIHSGDLVRLRGKANSMRQSTNKATRDRGIQLQRQLNWYKNFHKKKSQAVGDE